MSHVQHDMPAQPHTGLSTVHNLAATTCGELVKGQKTIVIDGSTAVESACDILVKNGISSAPVYDSASKTWCGMLDFRDIVAYLLLVLKKDHPLAETDDAQIKELIAKATISEPVTVKLTTDLSRKDPFMTILPEAPLTQAMEIFAKGIHRIAVVDGDGHMQGILSQSAVARFLKMNMKTRFTELEPVFNKKVADLGLVDVKNHNVYTIDSHAMTLEALKTMQKLGVSSLAVTDRNGNLTGNISMTDVKYIVRHSKLHLLWTPVSKYCSYVDQQVGMETGKDRYPVFDITPEATLGYALEKMIATKSHRVWVCDRSKSGEMFGIVAGKVVGIVSMTDVLRALVKNA